MLTVPDSPEGRELHFRSETAVPGPQDTRELGVAVSRLRLAGAGGRGPRALLAARFPWLLRDPRGLAFLSGYDTVMANSEYTRGWIRRLWRVDADVLYPPIQVDRLHPAVRSASKVVLSVGRFFAPGLGHAKRQLEMVQMFGRLLRAGQAGRLVDDRARRLRGLPAAVPGDGPGGRRRACRCGSCRTRRARWSSRSMSTASIFWSATGYGEDEERSPWSHEHFGMTTAEAMAGGCVPVVIDRAGQREIVRDGVDGFRWSSLDELAERTLRVGRRRAAAQPAGGLGGAPGPRLLRRGVRRPLARGRRRRGLLDSRRHPCR